MLMSFCLSPHWPQYTPSWSIRFFLSLCLSAFWRPYLCCSDCKISAWFIKTQSRAVLTALPEYCVSFTLCFSLCLCRGLILDSLYHVLSASRKSSWDPQEEKYALLPVFLAKQRYLSRHWLRKFRQGIMCKRADDSVQGKKQTNTKCLKSFNHKQDGENI